MITSDNQLHREFALITKLSEYPILAALIQCCDLDIYEQRGRLYGSLAIPAELDYLAFEKAFEALEEHGKELFRRGDFKVVVVRLA